MSTKTEKDPRKVKLKSKPVALKPRRHLALFDVHVPHNIDLSPVINFAKWYKPTDFIIGGDFLNLEWASHWNEREFKYIGLEKLSGMLENELLSGKKVLEQLTAALPKDCSKYYIPGNHEEWLYWACLSYPSLAGGLTLGVEQMTFKSDLAAIRKQVIADLIAKFLKLDDLGYKILPYDKELSLGKITYIHGHQVSTPAAMKRKYPARNVVCGHHHTEMRELLFNSGDLRQTNQYVFVPCLSRLSPGYLKGRTVRWANGFWIADILPTGNFSGQVVRIIDNKVVHGGKIFG